MKYELAVIGDSESISGFNAMGIRTYPAKDQDEALGILQMIRKRGYGVIFIIESYAKGMEKVISDTKGLPVIISIPGKEGSMGVGLDWLRRTAERAIGFDILKERI